MPVSRGADASRPRAVISLGTNTIRLLVVRDVPGGGVEQLEHGAIGTRLGERLRERGRLSPAAAERTLAAVRTFYARVRAHDAALATIATSAMRRADDASAFAAAMLAETGVPLLVLDGDEEAAASFRGAMTSAPRDGSRRAVLDVGGGSTECAAGRDGVLENARSVEIGSVRITERFPGLAGAHPGAAAHEAAAGARRAIAAELAWLAGFRPVVEVRAVAGTPLTLGAVAFASTVEEVSGRELPRAELDALLARLLDLSLPERKALPGMLAQRADIVVGGGLIVSEALRLLGVAGARLEADDLLLGFLLAPGDGGTVPGSERRALGEASPQG
jgi:exopolyphosphatase/guanosine-5'-triphosphate,3'-diphosphate pyrophosphatase